MSQSELWLWSCSNGTVEGIRQVFQGQRRRFGHFRGRLGQPKRGSPVQRAAHTRTRVSTNKGAVEYGHPCASADIGTTAACGRSQRSN